MFERFTDRARRVLAYAQDEARLLEHTVVGTEHILLGLIREGEGMASKALASLEVTYDDVRTRISAARDVDADVPPGVFPFSARAKKTLELSLGQALQFGHDFIGTEHLLLGLVLVGEGAAARILGDLGADAERVRARITQLMSDQASRRATAGPDSPADLMMRAVQLTGRSLRPDLDAASLKGRAVAISDELLVIARQRWEQTDPAPPAST